MEAGATLSQTSACQKGPSMKTIGWLIVAALTASPAFADTERGYVEATGSLGGSSASLFSGWLGSDSGGAQVGVHATKHLFVIGELGKYKSLQPIQQPAVDSAISNLSASGLDVTSNSHLSSGYGFGGVRVQGSTMHRMAPYVLGGVGLAHLTPSVTLMYADGTLPGADDSAPPPSTGTDVTTTIVTSGLFTAPATSNAMLLSLGGGATFDIARHLTADVGYRWSRINADTPIATQGVTFGVGARF